MTIYGAKLTAVTWDTSVEALTEFCGPPMCILLICVFKLPKLLKTQLHSVQLYVGPFFTFNETKENQVNFPNIYQILCFSLFIHITNILWGYESSNSLLFQVTDIQSGISLGHQVNCNLCAWLSAPITTSQCGEAPKNKTNVIWQMRPALGSAGVNFHSQDSQVEPANGIFLKSCPV